MTTHSEHPHIPQGHIPLTSYRLQLNADFTFNDARKRLPYIRNLGFTDIYLSPILQAAPGSTHGYDVVNHKQISAEAGGIDAFRALAAEAHNLGLGVIVDLVPNHMAVPTPVWHNRPMWSLLKRGKDSEYANWFDVELDSPIMMPILGKRIGQVLADNELELKKMVIPTEPERGEQWVLAYYDHIFPVAEGTESLPLHVLVERQNYRLAHWKVADEELNYRRFFDVGTLAAIRVEDPKVFVATHKLLLELYREGSIDAFRVDHPDGLADPRQYFRHLAAATEGAWVAAEKILEGDEQLPSDWPIAGTTGYDTMWRINALNVDPAAALPLGAIMHHMTGQSPAEYDAMVDQAKSQIIDTSLAAEVRRLGQLIWAICQDDLRLRDHTFRGLIDCLRQMVIEMDRYRAYIVPGESAPATSRAVIEETAERAKHHIDPDLYETLDVICGLVLGDEVGSAGLDSSDKRRDEVIVRFQQVCGAVMAKGVEDTTFYRWTHLVSLNEVGGSPQKFGITPDDVHHFAQVNQQNWPVTMTGGSTHDTKRCEDVRARINVISHYTDLWLSLITQARVLTQNERPSFDCGAAENLMWQIIAGTWDDGPIPDDRFIEYLTKAVREQKIWTSWTNPNENFEQQFFDFALAAKNNPDVQALFIRWAEKTTKAVRATLLSTKVIQMAMPGIADNYQGEEITQTSLVDPDNRRPIDYDALEETLDKISQHQPETLDEEKMLLTHHMAMLRRELPDVFVSANASYMPLAASSGHVFAFARGIDDIPQVAIVATRLAGVLERHNGWNTQEVVLPDIGDDLWEDVITHTTYQAGSQLASNLLSDYPVAILKRITDE